MLFGIVHLQDFVGMLNRLGEFTQPHVAAAGDDVSGDAQISVARHLCDVQRLLCPCQRLRDAPLVDDVDRQSP
jgi:hypothetical protein